MGVGSEGLAASAIVCARFLGADATAAEAAARAAVTSYRCRVCEYAELGHLATWYARIDEVSLLAALTPVLRRGAEQVMRKARQRTHLQVLDKLTDLVDDRRRIREEPPLIVRDTTTPAGRPIAEALDLFLQAYVPSLPAERRVLFQRYRIVDGVRKVVGVGSVGTRCWVIFLEGNGADDPLFLQVKEAQPSVLAPYVPKARTGNEGRRVGAAPDPGRARHLPGMGITGRSALLVRQLRDMKGGVEFDPREATRSLPGLIEYCRLCGWPSRSPTRSLATPL